MATIGILTNQPVPAEVTSSESTEMVDPTAKLEYAFQNVSESGYTTDMSKLLDRVAILQGYAEKIRRDVYKVATTRSRVQRIVVRINSKFDEQTVEDQYGHEHVRPAETVFAKEIVVDDLDELRKYTQKAYIERNFLYDELCDALAAAKRTSE